MRRCEGTDPNSLAFGVWVSNIRTAIRNRVPLGEDTGANHKKKSNTKIIHFMLVIENDSDSQYHSDSDDFCENSDWIHKLSLGIFK